MNNLALIYLDFLSSRSLKISKQNMFEEIVVKVAWHLRCLEIWTVKKTFSERSGKALSKLWTNVTQGTLIEHSFWSLLLFLKREHKNIHHNGFWTLHDACKTHSQNSITGDVAFSGWLWTMESFRLWNSMQESVENNRNLGIIVMVMQKSCLIYNTDRQHIQLQISGLNWC